MTNMKRREFLIQGPIAIASLTLGASLLVSGAACTPKSGGGDPLPDGQKALSPSDPVAAALKYQEKAATAEKPCKGCAQFTAVNSSWGRCNLFPQGLVAAQGNCSSWVARAS